MPYGPGATAAAAGAGGAVQASTSFSPTGGIANPPYSLVHDLAATNLVSNPSVETNTTGWAALGTSVTLTRSNTAGHARSGAYGLRIQKAAAVAGDGGGYTLTGLAAGQTYTFSVFVKALAGSPTLRLQALDNASAPVTTSGPTWAAGAVYARYSLTFTVGAGGNQAVLKIVSAASQNLDYVVDALQCEAGSRATSYCDGSLGAGYAWSGAAHASASSRAAGLLVSARPAGSGLATALGLAFDAASRTLRIGNAEGYYGDVGTTRRSLEAVFRVTETDAHHYGIAGILYAEPPSSTANIYGALDIGVVVPNGIAANFTAALYGNGGYVVHEGSGAISVAEGLAGVIWNGGSGSITVAAGVATGGVSLRPGQTGFVARNLGLWVNSVDSGKSSNIGIFVQQPGLGAGLAGGDYGNTTDAIGLLVAPGSPDAPSGNVQLGGSTTGTTTNAYGIAIYQPTYVAGSARTITNAASLYIQGEPLAGANVTFGAGLRYALKVDSGMSAFNVGTGFAIAFGAAIALAGNFAQTGGVYGIGMSSNITQTATNTGALGWLMGYYAKLNTAASAITLAQAAGLYVDDLTKGAGSTVTTQYGIYVAAQTQGATNWGIYVAGGPTYLGGGVVQPNPAAQAIASSGTVTITGGRAVLNPAAAVTGVIMPAGTQDGQEVELQNLSANTVTFAAAGTSRVLNGTGAVIAASRGCRMVWNANGGGAGTGRWIQTST